MGRTGLEPGDVSSHQDCSIHDPPLSGGAFSGAFLAEIGRDDPRLADLLAAWPSLPEAVKAGIVAMVKAAGE